MLVGEVAPDGAARDLLTRLGYLDGTEALIAHRAALLRAASRFHRMFKLQAADAPGLIALGAEVDPACVGSPGAPLASVSGCGSTLRQAFESCVGEGVEHLSQYAAPEDAFDRQSADEALADAPPALHELWQRLLPYRRNHDDAAPTDWTTAARLADGRTVRLPADICFRRPAAARDIETPWPLSTGCGAGIDHLAATLHGLLELIERDAVALWWRGGRRGRLLPAEVATPILARLRGDGSGGRRTWLLDISNDTGVPAVVAASCNDDGFGLCCGHAARPTLAAAASAAVIEMAQMELGYRVTAAKRAESGESALNAVDREHLRRHAQVDVARTPALHPLAPPVPPCDLSAQDNPSLLAALRRRLEAIGLAPCVLNLTRSAFGIPVTRTVCAGLENGMTAPPGPRLRAAAELSGTDPFAAGPL